MKSKSDKSLGFAIDSDETGDFVGLTLMTGKSIELDKVEALTLAQSIIRAILGWSSSELSYSSKSGFSCSHSTINGKRPSTPGRLSHKLTKVEK
jgi:hypothetical protein